MTYPSITIRLRTILQFAALLIGVSLFAFQILVDIYGTRLGFSSYTIQLVDAFAPNVIIPLVTYFIVSRLLAAFYESEFKEKQKITEDLVLERLGLKDVRDYGIKNITPNLQCSLQKLRERAVNSKNINILTTFLEESLLSYHELDLAARNGCEKIYVLMLNPKSELIKIREGAIDDSSFETLSMSDRIKNRNKEIEAYKIRLKKVSPSLSIEVRYYDSMPPVYFCMCGEFAVVGLYWHSVRTTQTQMFEVEGKESGFWQRLNAEFKHIWDLPTTVKPEDVSE